MDNEFERMLGQIEFVIASSEMVLPDDVKLGDTLEIEPGRTVIVKKIQRYQVPTHIWFDIYIEEEIAGTVYHDLRISTVNEKPDFRFKRILSN